MTKTIIDVSDEFLKDFDDTVKNRYTREEAIRVAMRLLMNKIILEDSLSAPTRWFYTPQG